MSREHSGGSPKVGFETIPIDSWSEDSFPVPIIDFDWETIYAQDEAGQEPSPVERKEAHAVLRKAYEQGIEEGMRLGLEEGRRQEREVRDQLLRWADSNGRGTFSGMANRMAVLQWFYNPDYRQCLQTDLLLRYGIENKQLLNRETVAFRDSFDQCDSRFYSEKAREVYRRREASKRGIGECTEVAAVGGGD